MPQKQRALRRRLSCLFIFSILSVSHIFAQTLSGSTTPIIINYGSTVIVDNTLTITSAFPINTVSVFIASGFKSTDVLSVNPSVLPVDITTSYNSGLGYLTITGTGTISEWETVLRAVAFSTTAFEAGTRQVTFVLGAAFYNAANGHYYQLDNSMTWTAAKASAESHSLFGMTGYFATVTSSSENSFINSKLPANAWMGCSDDFNEINAVTGIVTYANQAAAEGHWYWVSGPEKGTELSTTYSNWAASEPNNDNGTEHYLEINPVNNGAWNDLNFGIEIMGIIEYGSGPGDPVLPNLEHTRPIDVAAPALSGNTGTPGAYKSNNTNYVVDASVQVENVGILTDMTVNISEGFASTDVLSYNAALLPVTVSGNYNATAGVLSFSGVATGTEWNDLLQSVTFKTTSPNMDDRKITFNVGTLPASSEGHFYILSTSLVSYYNIQDYLQNYEPSLATINGRHGYAVNILSATENDFLQKKINTNFWMSLSDDYELINNSLGTMTYDDQYQSEGNFYWVAGPASGILATTGNSGAMTPEPGQYNNWQAGQPDDNNTQGNTAYFDVTNGKWYDESYFDSDFNYVEKNIVIEYGGTSGDPVHPMIFTRTMVYLATLPVDLVSFNVSKVNTTAMAEWVTASEWSNSYFNVERSSDNRHFSTIGRVDGCGTATGSQYYRFTDQQPLPGVNYYRLKQVDIDDHFFYSATRKIEFKINTGTSKIYPTVVTNELTVKMADAGKVQCLIINEAGNIVQRIAPSTAAFTIPVQSFTKGIYFLKIIHGSGNEENFKFIKQ